MVIFLFSSVSPGHVGVAGRSGETHFAVEVVSEEFEGMQHACFQSHDVTLNGKYPHCICIMLTCAYCTYNLYTCKHSLFHADNTLCVCVRVCAYV
jgi:hypothetical protein